MTEKLLYKLIGYNCSMKCHRLYLIADFENFSLDTLKMADICCYDTVNVNWGVREKAIMIQLLMISYTLWSYVLF